MSNAADAGRGEAGEARLHVASVVAIDGHDEANLFALAASVAGGLEARFADALLQAARERTLPVPCVDRLHDTTRAGVVATVDGHTVVLGSAALFAALGLSLESLGDVPVRLRRRSEQVLFVAVDGRTAGVVGVAATATRLTPDSWRTR